MSGWSLPAPGTQDAAKRASDAVGLALLADPSGNVGRWVACRLSDGGTDGVVYDTKPDAIRHQLHELQCMYVLIRPDGLPVPIAARLLELHRQMYAAGARVATTHDLSPNHYRQN